MASEKLPPVVFDDDNPEWTEEDFARARPAAEVLPPEVLAAFGKKRGRPAGTTKSDRQQVALRVPKPVIEHFKAEGPGWQTRMIQVLERFTMHDRTWFDEEVLYRRPDGSTEMVTLRRAVEKFIDLAPHDRVRADVELDSTITMMGGMRISGSIGAAGLSNLASELDPTWQ